VADQILNFPLRKDVENHLDLSIHEDLNIAECFLSQFPSSVFFDIDFCEEIFNHFT